MAAYSELSGLKHKLRCMIIMHLLIMVWSASLSKYRITNWSKYDKVNMPILTLWRRPLWQCVNECTSRTRCHVINYNRRRRECTLLTTVLGISLRLFWTVSSVVRAIECVHIKIQDVDIPVEYQQLCESCNTHQICEFDTNKCAYRECSPLEMRNADVFGNILTTGAKVRIQPYSGYILSSNSSISRCREDGTWSDVPSVLEETCPDQWYKISQSCYYIIDIRKTHEDAVAFCKIHESHLVTLETEAEHEALIRLLKRDFGSLSNWWLGIDDTITEGVWVYTHNNKTIVYRRWSTGEPNSADIVEEDCALLQYANTAWSDIYCNRLERVICEKEF